MHTWRTQRRQTPILRTATSVGILFLLEIMVGVLILTVGRTIFLSVLYVAAAITLWAMLVVLVVLAGLASVPAKESVSSPQ